MQLMQRRLRVRTSPFLIYSAHENTQPDRQTDQQTDWAILQTWSADRRTHSLNSQWTGSISVHADGFAKTCIVGQRWDLAPVCILHAIVFNLYRESCSTWPRDQTVKIRPFRRFYLRENVWNRASYIMPVFLHLQILYRKYRKMNLCFVFRKVSWQNFSEQDSLRVLWCQLWDMLRKIWRGIFRTKCTDYCNS